MHVCIASHYISQTFSCIRTLWLLYIRRIAVTLKYGATKAQFRAILRHFFSLLFRLRHFSRKCLWVDTRAALSSALQTCCCWSYSRYKLASGNFSFTWKHILTLWFPRPIQCASVREMRWFPSVSVVTLSRIDLYLSEIRIKPSQFISIMIILVTNITTWSDAPVNSVDETIKWYFQINGFLLVVTCTFQY